MSHRDMLAGCKRKDSVNTSSLEKLLVRPAHANDFESIRSFLLESSDLYPEIGNWWDSRVKPDLHSEARIALVVDSGTSLEGLFIGKQGKSAKLCTLRLRESIRNRGVGRALVTEGLHRLWEPRTTRFHVTVSEAAEEGSTAFFESIGFRRIAVQPGRYQQGVDEFIYACPTADVIEMINNGLSEGIERTLLGAIPRPLPNERTLLMSLRPEFAALMSEGRKTVELRRRFSKKYEGATIVFYITHPVRSFVLSATIAKVDHKPKTEIWKKYSSECGISKDVFSSYFSGTDNGYAIELIDIKRIPNQLALEQAQRFCPHFRPPQSFQTLEPSSPLLRALDLPVHI